MPRGGAYLCCATMLRKIRVARDVEEHHGLYARYAPCADARFDAQRGVRLRHAAADRHAMR